MNKRLYPNQQEFKCSHCRYLVPVNIQICAVHNRNHCPYCLWSRHVDLYRAGDRLSACKAGMRPVGLALKHTYKRYRSRDQGELMLIHQCTGCGALSLNRIAADDDPDTLMAVFEVSPELTSGLGHDLERAGIVALTAADANLVQRRLYGLAVPATLQRSYAV